MIKSPLRYPGGKSRAVKFIAPLIPKFDEYREPFVGGGSVFVYLKQKYPNKKYWINDLYTNLFHFWNKCKNDITLLINQINEWKNIYGKGKELYYFLMNNIDYFDDLKKASAFFVFNRITFSGTTESGGFSKDAFEKRFTISSIERVKALSTVLHSTKITNHDFEQVIKRKGENIFLFLDPPYYSARKSALYGKNGNMHKKFVSTWNLSYGMRNVNKNRNQMGKELFISNYANKIHNSKKQINLFRNK
ncbi:MAG: modification methylase [Bacteroidetes bacterium 4572_128]|nr:MAG: modification methylase [Bacteroidetes bacterium 4572_128]